MILTTHQKIVHHGGGVKRNRFMFTFETGNDRLQDIVSQ